MTSTLNRRETTTMDVSTYKTSPPVLRRSDASGEFPFYQPKTIGDVDELARLALEATLVHEIQLPPIDSLPEAVRRPKPSVHRYTPVLDLPYPPRPAGYKGAHRGLNPVPPPVAPGRRAGPRWARDAVMYGFGMASAAALFLVVANILAAIR